MQCPVILTYLIINAYLTLFISWSNPLLHKIILFYVDLWDIIYESPIVYRLINAVHKGNIFDDPFLFQSWNLSQPSFVKDAVNQRVNF